MKAAADDVVDVLDRVGQTDPSAVHRFRDTILDSTRHVVTAARAMLLPVLAGAGLSAGALLVLAGYFGIPTGATRWFQWLGFILAAAPLLGLSIYVWVLLLAMRFPAAVSELSDRFCDALERFRQEDPSAEAASRTGWRARISTLIRYGRFAIDLRNLARSPPDLRGFGPIHAVAVTVNPLFWVGYVGLLAWSCLAAVIVLATCLIHSMLA